MSTIKQSRGTPWKQTASGAASAVATQVGVANQTIYLTDLSGSSDKAGATITVKSGVSTVIYNNRIGNTNAFSVQFSEPLNVASFSLSATVTGTNVANVNMSGFIINNT